MANIVNVQLERSIKEIDKDSVHKICSGQVVLTLAVAVKELLENSLDAGSTCIEIKLKEHGTELVEVIDNGCGLEEANFEALALKYYTSKIQEFSDLENIETFGFRGEALSSLCALSNVSVVTRHKDSSSGVKLEYDHGGKLLARTIVPRQIGTTVILKDLFCTLPVRHQEFVKNARREFYKMVTVLTAYCIISTGVRITCTHQIGKNQRVNVIASHGLPTIKDNIITVFDTKQAKSLIEFVQHVPSEDVLDEYSLAKESVKQTEFQIEGFVSSCDSGTGRSSTDRQFFFINRRPCELPKVGKVINEVYHAYNRNQYPVVILNINLTRNCVDVNVTPDKRKLFFENEKLLLAIVKHSLSVVYEKKPALLEVKIPTQLIFESSSVLKPELNSSTVQKSPTKQTSISVEKTATVSLVGFKRNFAWSGSKESAEKICHAKSPLKKQPRLETVMKFTRKLDFSGSDDNGSLECTIDKDFGKVGASEILENSISEEVDSVSSKCERGVNQIEILDEQCDTNKKIGVINYSLEKLKIDISKSKRKSTYSELKYQKFKAKISPQDNVTAEQELHKELHKNMFAQMEIIGQFNLGFIIVKLDCDLFIIDQHASDEKFNYMSLIKSNFLTTQRLIIPQDLQLSSVDESLLLENLSIFQRNGFEFIVKDEFEPSPRVTLLSIPQSKNWSFGKSDIEELLFMLRDSSGVMCRPSRVYQMLASRACRKSIMIGTNLNYSNMRKVVDHMGEIDQPWNCPHGRPTIRHLLNLKMLSSHQ